jgi:hypothetical protein
LTDPKSVQALALEMSERLARVVIQLRTIEAIAAQLYPFAEHFFTLGEDAGLEKAAWFCRCLAQSDLAEEISALKSGKERDGE